MRQARVCVGRIPDDDGHHGEGDASYCVWGKGNGEDPGRRTGREPADGSERHHCKGNPPSNSKSSFLLYWRRVGLQKQCSSAPSVGVELRYTRGALALTEVKFKIWLCGVTTVFTLHCRKRQVNTKETCLQLPSPTSKEEEKDTSGRAGA